MTKETLDTTNKLIKAGDISTSDDCIIRQLSENLQNITPKDVDAMCDAIDEEKRKWEAPQELKDFRKKWNEKMHIDESIKKKIEDVSETIPVKVETDDDGSRLIEFKL